MTFEGFLVFDFVLTVPMMHVLIKNRVYFKDFCIELDFGLNIIMISFLIYFEGLIN